jgi:hypothetical protein
MVAFWKRLVHRAPAVSLLLALLVLLPGIGNYGLWDPHEIGVADQARELATSGKYAAVYAQMPPLETWLIAASVKLLGPSEFGARLPLVLLGALTCLATCLCGLRLGRPRAGLFGALVLLSSPLFVFQSRQLTSDIGALAGPAVAMLGLIGLAWPQSQGRGAPRWALDSLCTVAGLLLGHLASGLLLGVLVPVATVACALLAARVGGITDDTEAPSRGKTWIAAGSVVVALAVLCVILAKIYDVVPAPPGTRALFGRTLAVAKGYLPLLGGAWTTGEPPSHATFDYVIVQVAWGMFPFSALAPLAVLRLCGVPERHGRQGFGGLVLLFWSLVAFVVATVWVRRVGPLRFPGLVPIALAVGVLVDDILEARFPAHPDRPLALPSAQGALPLLALFAVLAAIQLARDCLASPDELTSVHVLATAKYPVETHLMPIVLGFGVVFAASAAAGLLLPPSGTLAWLEPVRRVGKYGLHAMLAVGLAFGLFLSLVFTPGVSEHFSYKNVFEGYFDHRRGQEPLGVMGIPGSGPDYYARGKFQALTGRTQLLSFLQGPERVFAISPASELCAVQQASSASHFPYYVLDDRNSRFLLFSNQLRSGESDKNPLQTAIRREAPTHFERAVEANFEGKIQLLGVDMPDTVAKGERFPLTLWFKVLEKPGTNYKIFLHFDGTGVRFQGDHEPIKGRCGTSYWQPGDIIQDTYEVTAGELTHPRGSYNVWAGFFTGSSGSWKNMTVLGENHDTNNRVNLGTLRLK